MIKKIINEMSLAKKICLVICFISVISLMIVLYYNDGFNFNSRRTYQNDDLGFAKYESSIDKDSDGIEDQRDMYESAKEYIQKKPKYQDKYYSHGYPDDNYGVSTDIVAFAMLGSGYNIKQLMAEDIKKRKKDYNITKQDINIDFRRSNNMKVYLDKHAKSLTLSPMISDDWQAGDIVILKNDAGIISNKRNAKGVPYVMHLTSETKENYEEDFLEKEASNIIGHYRIS